MARWELDSARRLAALCEVDTFPGVADEEFDCFTRLVSRLLDAPAALVTFVTNDRQYFPSAIGLDEPWATRGQTPLDYSFCKFVVMHDEALIVHDAENDARVKDNPAVTELGVKAYLGVPLRAPGGEPLGSLCAVSDTPRRWTEDDVDVLRDIAEAATATISLRVNEHRRALDASEASHNLRTPLAALRLELDDIALAVREVSEQAVSAAVTHVNELATIVDRLLATTQYSTVRHSPQDLFVVAREVAQRRCDVGEAQPGDVVIDGATVKVLTPLSVLRYAVDVLLHCASQATDEPLVVRVVGNGVARLQIHGSFADEVAAAPLPDPLIKQLRAKLIVRPSDDLAYELVLPIAL